MARTSVHWIVLALCATSWGCSREEDSVLREQAALREGEAPREQALSPRPAQGSPPLAERLRNLHEEADAARSEREQALSAERLLSLYEATATEDSPHLLAVRQDLAARAAQLFLEGSPIRAKESAERGLSLSNTPSVLRANLLLALADAEEALGNQVKAKSALVEALVVNEELFKSEMETP